MKNPLIDGHSYGNATVISIRNQSDIAKERTYNVRCTECGTEFAEKETRLRKNRPRCPVCVGPMRTEQISVEPGKRFGSRTVLRFVAEHGKYRYKIWECRCDCGKVENITEYSLRYGRGEGCRRCSKIPKTDRQNPFRDFSLSETASRADDTLPLDRESIRKRRKEEFREAGMIYKPKVNRDGYTVVRCDVFTAEGFLNEHAYTKGLEEWVKKHRKKEYTTDDWIAFLRERDEELRRGIKHNR